MSKKNYYGQVCITACLDFYVSDTEESIEEIKDRILDYGFDVKLVDENGDDIPKNKIEITQVEGQLINHSTRGNVKESYTDDFWIEIDD